MALDFNLFKVIEVKNPSKECVEVRFSDVKANDLKTTSLVIFETQVKYIITEEYETHKRVKVYSIDDDDAIVIDFYPEEYYLFETFFMALYNKTI
jgi:ASC-1-like (ASCH) protein